MAMPMPSPLLRIDRQGVIGHLKTAGTRDPDVLYAHKTTLLQAVRFPKTVGTYLMILGVLLTLTILGAFLGIPLLIAGWFVRRRGVKNIRTVEATYEEFLSPTAAAAN